MSLNSLTAAFSSERFKLWLTGILTTQFSVYIGWLVSWYKDYIPLIADPSISSGLAAFIAATAVSLLIPIIIIFASRVDRVVALLTELAEAEKAKYGETSVKHIAMTSDKAADEQPSNLVIGPSDYRRV